MCLGQGPQEIALWMEKPGLGMQTYDSMGMAGPARGGKSWVLTATASKLQCTVRGMQRAIPPSPQPNHCLWLGLKDHTEDLDLDWIPELELGRLQDRWLSPPPPPSRGEQFKFIPCGQKLQNISSRTIKREGWTLPPIRDHIFLILKVKVIFLTRKLLGGQKGSTVNIVKSTHRLWRNTSWLRGAHAHMDGSWDKPNTNSEPGKANDRPNENPEEMLHKSDSNYHKGVTLSLSPPTCISACAILFFFLINTLLASLLSVYLWKRISWKAIVARVFSQATGPWCSSGYDSALSLTWPNFSL